VIEIAPVLYPKCSALGVKWEGTKDKLIFVDKFGNKIVLYHIKILGKTCMEIDTAVSKALEEFMTTGIPPEKVESKATPEPIPEPPKKSKNKVVAKEGQKLFSEFFGYKPYFGDFAVDMHPVDGFIAGFVPSADPDYVVQHDEAAELVFGIQNGDRIMLSGPTGSGKSSLVKFVCAKLGRPFLRINMTGDITSDDVFGSKIVEDGSIKWVDGPFTEAVKHGAVVLSDEWELMPAEITMGLQHLLEDDGYLYLNSMPGTSADKKVVPHQDFRFIVAGNTTGTGDDSGAFAGTQVQNTATIDRFSLVIKLKYLTEEHEVAMIMGKAEATKTLATKMYKVASLIRSSYMKQSVSLTMSPRTLINWARKTEVFGVAKAFEKVYACKLNDTDNNHVKQLAEKVFGKDFM
jgi:cobaltochelatase CobS subunit